LKPESRKSTPSSSSPARWNCPASSDCTKAAAVVKLYRRCPRGDPDGEVLLREDRLAAGEADHQLLRRVGGDELQGVPGGLQVPGLDGDRVRMAHARSDPPAALSLRQGHHLERHARLHRGPGPPHRGQEPGPLDLPGHAPALHGHALPLPGQGRAHAQGVERLAPQEVQPLQHRRERPFTAWAAMFGGEAAPAP
jgi:hypothetical protein